MEAERGLRLEKAFARGAGHGSCASAPTRSGRPCRRCCRIGASLRHALRDGAVRPARSRRGRHQAACPAPHDGELDRMAAAVPPMPGAEYLTAAVLGRSLARHGCGLRCRAGRSQAAPCRSSSNRRHPAWNLVGRVHFNLAENRKDEEAPFAFLATYTTRLSAQAKAQHLPLGQALAANMPARPRTRAAAVAADAGAARRRAVRLAEGDGRRGRDLSSAALDAARGAAVPDGRPAARERRRGRAHAGDAGARTGRRARR